MRKGEVIFTPTEFAAMLEMPGAMILDIKVDHFGSGNIEVVLVHPDFEDKPEGSHPERYELRKGIVPYSRRFTT